MGFSPRLRDETTVAWLNGIDKSEWTPLVRLLRDKDLRSTLCANWWLTSRIYDDPTSLTGPPQPYSTSPHQTSPTDPPQPYPASDKRKVRIKQSPLQDPHTGRALRASLKKTSLQDIAHHS